ncbi:hypothetical protein B7463_g5083, partial [Scytalidium lignicola]
MKKHQSASDFEIHVDPSCLSEQVDIGMSTISASANQVIQQDNLEDREFKRSLNDLGENSQSQDQKERTEALIQSAARAIVASIERTNSFGLEDSVLSAQTDRSYDNGSEVHEGSTELPYGSGAAMYEPEIEHNWDYEREGGDSTASHNDGDIDDDDIFSRNSGQSARSSLNSCHDLHSPDELSHEKQHASEDAMEPISRIPSVSSYSYNPEVHSGTPNKTGTRPPFRTPSSVRAMQMSSPTPSIFSTSPRSVKRASVSRLGTPTAQKISSSPTTKSKTPTRFKVKKEYPLVLLHVTVFPLQWSYANIITSPDIPTSLYGVRDSWRLLQEKLGDTVLERGVLLPHPQDSYEVLEERLLEALELPVQPRARILKCGHYMGPLDNEVSEESGDDMDSGFERALDRKWCDICCREVKYMNRDPEAAEQRFRVKIYASNGLMRAGAWAAVWKEMERVDVEIEPYVEADLLDDLERFSQKTKAQRDQEGEFEDIHGVHDDDAKRADEERMREIYDALPPAIENFPQMESQPSSVPPTHIPHMESPPSPVPPTPIPQMASPNFEVPPAQSHPKNTYGDSLPELIFAAIKVAIRDPKNIIICALSALLLFLALRPGLAPANSAPMVTTHSEAPHIIGGLDHAAVQYTKEEPLVREPVAVVRPKVPTTKPVVKNIVKKPVRASASEANVKVKMPPKVQEAIIAAKPVEAQEVDIVVEEPLSAQETEVVIEEPLDVPEAETIIEEHEHVDVPEDESIIEETLDVHETETVDDELPMTQETNIIVESPAVEENDISAEGPADIPIEEEDSPDIANADMDFPVLEEEEVVLIDRTEL